MQFTSPPFLSGPCDSCPAILKTLACCPRFDVFESGQLGPIILECFWVIASLIPVLISLGLIFQVITKRTLREILLLANLAIQQISCAFLKRVFAQARPFLACSNSYGNPSEYSGFAAALATWLLLEVVILNDQVTFKREKSYGMLRNSMVLFAPFIAMSRYFLNYNSSEQIYNGLVMGLACALLWFGVLMKTLKARRNSNSFLV